MAARRNGIRLYPPVAGRDLLHCHVIPAEKFRDHTAADPGVGLRSLPACQGAQRIEALGDTQEGDGRFAAGIILQLATDRREAGQGGEAV